LNFAVPLYQCDRIVRLMAGVPERWRSCNSVNVMTMFFRNGY
jgi:hypothetical protein